MSAITAVTSQNTQQVTTYMAMPVDLVKSQIEDVASDIGLDVIKTGVLLKPQI